MATLHVTSISTTRCATPLPFSRSALFVNNGETDLTSNAALAVAGRSAVAAYTLGGVTGEFLRGVNGGLGQNQRVVARAKGQKDALVGTVVAGTKIQPVRRLVIGGRHERSKCPCRLSHLDLTTFPLNLVLCSDQHLHRFSQFASPTLPSRTVRATPCIPDSL